MSPYQKKYKKEYAFELLRIAQGDFGSAKILVTATGGRPENVIYLCQQAIEKSLKAVHCFLKQTIVHSHDLEALVQSLPDDKRPPNAHQLVPLTQYATVRRYEEGYEQLEKKDLEEVIQITQAVLTWSKSIVRD